MRRVYAPWVGSPGVVESVTLEPTFPIGTLQAAAVSASFHAAGTVAAPPNNSMVALAQVAHAGFAVTNTDHAVLHAASDPATMQSYPTGTLQAAAGLASFSGALTNTGHGLLAGAAQVAGAVFAGTVGTALSPAASADFNLAKKITLGTTLRASGAGPVVSLSVTPASGGSLTYATNPPAIYVEITTGGALNVGAFKVSYDGGQTFAHTGVTLPSGGTYDLDGIATGNRLTFAAGTYATPDTYKSTLASITSDDTNGYVLAMATAATQPIFGKDATGYFFQTAGAQYIEATTAGLLALSANDPALTIMMEFAPVTADATEDLLVWSQTGGTNGQRRIGKSVTGTGRLTAVAVDDSGVSTNTNQTRGVDDLTNGGVVKFCWKWPGSNGGVTCRVNDANSNPSGATWNPGTTVTHGRLAWGATHDNAVRRQSSAKFYRLVMWNSAISGAGETAWNAAI